MSSTRTATHTSIRSKLGGVFSRAAKAVRDGYAASMASVVSVFLLMWLRTTMSYQHVHGVSMTEAISALYADGGILRFYHGILWALLMMPLSRFGDVASNEVAREFLSSQAYTPALVTAVASTMAAMWRMFITPFDTIKTLLQVHGSKKAMPLLREKIRNMGMGALYEGAFGSAAATWVGHYPWFVTFNFLEAFCIRHEILDAHLSPQEQQQKKKNNIRRHVRRALVGLCCSLVSDVCSNALRVVKTYKQTYPTNISYTEAATRIVESTGLPGLLFRGLSSKLVSNALNAMLFTVLWKAISERLAERRRQQQQQKDEVLQKTE